MSGVRFNSRIIATHCSFFSWFFCIRYTLPMQFDFFECSVMATVSFLVALSIAICARRFGPYSRRIPIVVSASVLASLGTLTKSPITLILTPVAHEAAGWLGCVFIGISTSVLFIVAMETLGWSKANEAERSLALAGLLSVPLSAALSAIPADSFPYVVAALPLIAGAAAIKADKDESIAEFANLKPSGNQANQNSGASPAEPDMEQPGLPLPARPVLMMAAATFAACFGTFPFVAQEISSPAMGLGVACISIALLAGRTIPYLVDRFNVRMLFQASLPIMTAGLLAAPLAPQGLGSVAACAMVNVGYFGFLFLTIVILNENCRRERIPHAWAFGFLRCAMLPSQLIGAGLVFINAELGSSSSFIWLLYSISQLAIVACSVAFLNNVNFIASWNLSRKNGEAVENPAAFSLATRCAMLARTNGLTHREEEVCFLVAQGKTVPQAAEELFVSKETAKSHLKHVYSKLGIHSKEELLERIERQRLD